MCFCVGTSAGSDYTAISRQLDFSAGTTEQCVSVATTEDNILEEEEQFRATLTNVGNIPRLTVQPDESTVTIPDDDGRSTYTKLVAECFCGSCARTFLRMRIYSIRA